MRHSTVRSLILAFVLTQCCGVVFGPDFGSQEHWIATQR